MAEPLRLSAPLSLPTLAALESSSIAQGYEAADAILKEAPVTLLLAAPASPGKFFILFTGEVEEARRALMRGVEVAADTLLDEILIPAAEESLRECLLGPREVTGEPLPAVGLLESFGAPTLLGAADTAVKTGATRLFEIHLLAGIGGKSTAALQGDVESVRVAVEAGADFARQRQQLVREIVIPRPDAGLGAFLGERGRRAPGPPDGP